MESSISQRLECEYPTLCEFQNIVNTCLFFHVTSVIGRCLLQSMLRDSIWQAAESVPLAITRKSIISSPADCFILQRALIKSSSSPFSHPACRPLQILHCHAISRRGSRFATTTTSSTDLNLEGGGGGRGSNVLSAKHKGPLCS